MNIKHLISRLFVLLLSIGILLPVLTTNISAIPLPDPCDTSEACSLSVGAKTGDIIVFGEYDGEPIKWRVLGYDRYTTYIRLISEDIIYLSRFGSSTNYETSVIRAYLTGDFLKNFTSEELSVVKDDRAYSTKNVVDGSYYHLKDKFFLLSSTEVGLESDSSEGYNIGFTSNADRIAYLNGSAGWWWLRTPFVSGSFSLVRYVLTGGGLGANFSPSASGGVRPACEIGYNTPVYLWSDGYYHLEEEAQNSNYSVLLPKQVDVSNNSSSFDMLAKGSIKNNEILNVSLDKSIDLVDQTAGSNKDNVPVSVDQSEFNFYKADLSSEYVDGGNADKTITLTHDTLSAGEWSADLNISIKLNIDETKKHNISYDPDGGTMPDTYPTEFYEGECVTDLPVPTKDGFEFIGWYESSDPDTIITEISDDTSEDVELIAKWEPTLKEITLMQGSLFSNAVEDYFPNAKKIIFVNEGIPSDKLNDKTPILSDDLSTGLAYGYMDDDGKTLIVAPEADNMTMYAHRNAGLMFNIDGLLDVEFVNFDTSRTDNMQWMFYCNTLRSISGYENWDVSNVTTMNKMFQSAHDLDGNLDFSKWNTSSLTNIDNMFEGCISLDEIDLSGWNIKGVNSLNSVFDRCNNLMYIDLSTWDARNVTSMIRTFTETGSLEYIKTPYNLNSDVSIKLADNLVVTDSTWYDTDDSMREYPEGTFPLGIVTSHKLVKDKGDVTYNIHYESIDDLIMPDDYPTSYKPGDTFDLPVPKKTGTDPCDKWEFVGWITRDDETITKITSDMTGDISIVASWAVYKNYNCSIIQYDPNGGSLEGVIEDDIPNNQVYDNYFPKYEGLLYEDFATPINEGKDFYGWFDISPAKVTIRNEDDKIQIVGNGTSLLQHYLLDDGSSTHRLFIDETDVRPVNSLEHLILINGTANGTDITDIKLRVGDDDNVYSLDKLSSLNGKYLDLWFIVPKGETFELSFHSTIGDAGNDTSIMPRIDQETFMEYGNIDPIVKGSDKDIPGGYLYRVRAHWDPFTATAIDASEVVTGMVDEGFEIVYSRMMKTVSNVVDTLFRVDTEVFDNSIDFVYTLMCDDQSQSLHDENFDTETNIDNAIEGNSIEIEVGSQISEDQISSGVEDLPKEEIGINTTNDVSEDTTINSDFEQSK